MNSHLEVAKSEKKLGKSIFTMTLLNKKTEALCPICLERVPAEKLQRGQDVWLQRECTSHGLSESRIARDAERFFDKTFSVPGKDFEPSRAYDSECGKNCGWCERHEQHICTGLIEITDKCNLACPICYFGSKGEDFISIAEFQNRVKALLAVERGHLDVLQISGGECFLHPDWPAMLEWALAQDIGRIAFNTNGLALLDPNFDFDKLVKYRDRAEVYLQFDGFDDAVYGALRNRPLLAEKLAIIKKLDAAEVKICLAATVYVGNLKEVQKILKFATEVKHISGVTFQRLTKVGCAREATLDSVLQEDILLSIASSGLLAYKDMIPLPCSHENCTSLGFLFCSAGEVYSLGDYVDFTKCKAVLSDRIAFDKTVLDYMKKNVCDCFLGKLLGNAAILKKLQDFATGQGSLHKDMKILRVLVKNFMDAETFDFDRARKCCTAVSTANGRIVPFCIHNSLKGKI